LKVGYDVQLPFAAYFYLNVLTLSSSPAELLERLRERVEATLARFLERLHGAEERWTRLTADEATPHQRVGVVLTLAELRNAAEAKIGADTAKADLATLSESLPATLDKRERSLRLAHRLWTLSGLSGPAVALYYSPPYYPHAQAAPGALHDAMAAVAANHPELQLQAQEFYPYISDMSYLRLDPGMDLAAHYADMQFSTLRTMASMKEHRARLDQKLASFGRKPEDCGILWSVRVQVAESEEAARAMEEHYLDSIPPEAGLIELIQRPRQWPLG
jgi:arginine utilization protein RocB